MLARVSSAAVNGIEAFPVEVEINCGWGDHYRHRPPAGCGGEGVADRVTTGMTNSGFKFPMGRCAINLAAEDVGLRRTFAQG
jgi:magnesium chelatase family protein